MIEKGAKLVLLSFLICYKGSNSTSEMINGNQSSASILLERDARAWWGTWQTGKHMAQVKGRAFFSFN